MPSSSEITFGKGSDEFTVGVQSFFDVLAKRWQILVALGVILLIAAGVLAYRATRNAEKSDAGRNALYFAQKSLDTSLAAIAKAEAPAPKIEKKTKTKKAQPAAPNADTVMFKVMDVDTQLAKPVEQLKAVSTQFAGTPSGLQAALILGQLYLDHGQSAKAGEWFEKAATMAKNPLDQALSYESLGYADENQAKYKDALDAFDSALKIGEPTLQADLLMAKARTQVALKNSKEAKATYDQVTSLFPNSEYAKLADLYKARLK